jgi:hypothetical protein
LFLATQKVSIGRVLLDRAHHQQTSTKTPLLIRLLVVQCEVEESGR